MAGEIVKLPGVCWREDCYDKVQSGQLFCPLHYHGLSCARAGCDRYRLDNSPFCFAHKPKRESKDPGRPKGAA